MADCNRNCCNDCGRERKYPCDTYMTVAGNKTIQVRKMSIQN